MSSTQVPVDPPRSGDLVLLEFRSPSSALLNLRPPAMARSLPLIILGLVSSMIAIGILLPIDRVAIAAGRVISQSPTMNIQPLEAAIVRSVEVRVGQVVRAGDVVARLDPTFATADLAALEERAAVLALETERLEAENERRDYQPVTQSPAATLQTSLFRQRKAEREFRIESFRQRMASYESTIARGEAEAQYLRQRLQLATQVESMRRELQRAQVGSRLNALIATDTRVEMTRALASAEATIRVAQDDMRGVRAERDAYEQQWRTSTSQDLVLRQRDLSDVREQINKARLRRELVELTAPNDGIVLSVGRVSPGSVLAAGSELITMIPLDAALEVEAEVRGSDSGFVQVGQTADVKFESFPFIRHGKARGHVRVLSADSFRVNEGGQAVSPFYRVRIALDEVALHNMPPDFRLVPGMPVSVDIRVGERNLVSYFFENFLPPATEAFREP
jgi:HlyD family secretion protein